MAGSFHSTFDIGAHGPEVLAAFQVALRLAEEKGGQAWISEDGEVVAALVLTSRLADTAAGEPA